MKQKVLLLVMTAISLAGLYANAQESEPNDLYTQANTLALNGISYGAINVSGDIDWWKVTTTGDGKLNVIITISNGKYMYWQVYDNNGTTLLASENTNTTKTLSPDGLAAGTYYIKCYSYYAGELPAYTISNTLNMPTESNDTEPNNIKSQAKVLPLNGSKTGHVNYYYNSQRDAEDWYKVTTNADGRLRLRIKSGNNNYIWAYLFDNNGITLLSSDNTNATTKDINADGLAAGTYYIRINSYYDYLNNNYSGTNFEPYTIEDSLFIPAQVNDIEPNDTKAQAITFAPNSTITGHINYYYNLLKDGFDWYAITIPDDGNININISSNNGQYVWAYLYDNDGTTQISAAYTSSNSNYNVDGLQAGTYYMRVNTYYTDEFAPYTITNTFTTYSKATDTAVNKYPYQAKTLKANEATTGHVNFYYNNQKDSVDWYKINYTGSGALTLNILQDPHISNGSLNYLWVYVYKDTLSPPIASQYSLSGSWQMNLNTLTQGYYYIKLKTYYSNEFVSYSIEDVFIQSDIAKIKIISYDTSSSCSSSNNIVVKPNKSHTPYTIQLYRYGIAYGTEVIANDNKKIKFNNLPTGSYYFTCFGDGASGSAFSKSRTVSLEPIPTSLNTTGITNIRAVLNWGVVSCASFFTIQYRVQGSPTWLKKKTKNANPSFVLKGLTPNTVYEWQVATSDSANGIIATGQYSVISSFTTDAAFTGNNEGVINLTGKGIPQDEVDGMSIFPNPANAQFKIKMSTKLSGTADIILKSINGKVVWNALHKDAASINGTTVNTSNLPNGIYMLQVVLQDGKIYNNKVVISR